MSRYKVKEAEAYKERQLELKKNGNRIVARPIAKLSDDIVPRKGKKSGRPKKYTPRRLKNQVNKYFSFCEETDEMPSISGLVIHLKMYRNQFYLYLKDPEFSDILEQARLIIKSWVEHDVYTTTGKTDGKVAYMKNIHGWADKLETQSVVEQRIVSVDEAKAKIESLAPRLLELLKNSELVNQVADKAIEAEVIKENG